MGVGVRVGVDVGVEVGVWVGVAVGVGVSVGRIVGGTVEGTVGVVVASAWATSGAVVMTQRLTTVTRARTMIRVKTSDRWFRESCIYPANLSSSQASRQNKGHLPVVLATGTRWGERRCWRGHRWRLCGSRCRYGWFGWRSYC